MPVCKGCGGSYDNTFQFCPFCGRAKPEPESLKVQVSVSLQDKWETCKIYMTKWNNGSIYVTSQFWAEAIGPNGEYLAGESLPFPYFLNAAYNASYKGDAGVISAHTFLVNQLAADGWEAIPSGGEWWQTQFQRQMDGNNPKPWTSWFVGPYSSGITKHRFTLERIKDTKHTITGKDSPDWEFHGLSREFKGGLGKIGQSKESTKILDEFVQQMISEGFESLNPKVIEELTRSTWYYRAFLKR
jgi:hypothetical protein